jgi:hypothetical protein
MGLNLKLKGIVSPNPFKLLYKTGATAGNESVVTTGYTYYPNSSTTYQASSDGSYYNTNPIIFSGASYNTQYWFKILDTVTGGYVIENIFTNHEEVYDNCINCCLFTGGTSNYIDCRFSGGSAISDQIITPSPTPTTTPADCTFTGGSSEYDVIITPTPTTTTTIIEPTITPTITPTTTPQLYWNISNGAGGRLTVYDKDENVLLDENVNLSGTGKSGTLNISQSVLPYKIKGWWQNGSGNLVYFKVCDITNAVELHTSSPLGPSQLTTDEEYIVTPTPLNVSVSMWKDGQIAAVCPV